MASLFRGGEETPSEDPRDKEILRDSKRVAAARLYWAELAVAEDPDCPLRSAALEQARNNIR